MDVQQVPIGDLILDSRLQMRAKVDPAVVEDYCEAIFDLPPVSVVRGPEGEMWLTDGWQRHAAHVKTSQATIACQVAPGTWLDAFTAALGANADHGLRRTNDDKRQAVLAALKEWPDENNVKLARICRVSDFLIAEVRKSLREPPKASEPPPEQLLCTSCRRRIRVGQPIRQKCPECKELRESPPTPPRPTEPIIQNHQNYPKPVLDNPKLPPLCRRCLDVGLRIDDCRECQRIESGAPPKAPKPLPGPLVDSAGVVVPTQLVGVFETVPLFKELALHLHRAADVFKKIEESPAKEAKPLKKGPYEEFSIILRRAEERARNLVPTMLHERCGNDGCDGCKGRGWLTAEEAAHA